MNGRRISMSQRLSRQVTERGYPPQPCLALQFLLTLLHYGDGRYSTPRSAPRSISKPCFCYAVKGDGVRKVLYRTPLSISLLAISFR